MAHPATVQPQPAPPTSPETDSLEASASTSSASRGGEHPLGYPEIAGILENGLLFSESV